jgi:hypothetical protein
VLRNTSLRPAMAIKHGVSLEVLTPQAVLAVCITASVVNRFGYGFTLTSGRDGRHIPGSLHAKGRAFDFRSRDIPEGDREDLFSEVREALGPEFDVVVESDHVHVEWDPDYLKGKPSNA